MAGSTIKAWWGGKPLDEIERYTVLEYHDKSKPIEIHMPECVYVRKLGLLQEDKEVYDYENHLVMGPLEKAEARAARIVAEENRPSGWKRAPCCFDPNWKDTGPTLEEMLMKARLRNPYEGKEYYHVRLYPDRSRYVEIHKPDCMAWRKEMEKYNPEQGLVSELMIIGPVEEAEKSAELNVKTNNYPGWKRAECCFK